MSSLLLLVPTVLSSQTKLFISNTSKVIYNLCLEWEDADTVVFVKRTGNLNFCDHYKVYFDKSLRNLAYSSHSSGDTCTTQDFWRDGGLKKKTVYVKQPAGHPLWWFEEVYCQNGQVVFKGPSPNQPAKNLHTNYYCNGNKKVEFYNVEMGADGKMTRWFESGQVQSETYFDKNGPTGDWKFWSEKGKLIKTERYVEGELIKMQIY